MIQITDCITPLPNRNSHPSPSQLSLPSLFLIIATSVLPLGYSNISRVGEPLPAHSVATLLSFFPALYQPGQPPTCTVVGKYASIYQHVLNFYLSSVLTGHLDALNYIPNNVFEDYEEGATTVAEFGPPTVRKFGKLGVARERHERF